MNNQQYPKGTSPESNLEQTIFGPLRRTTPGFYLIFGALSLVFLWGLYAYSLQLREGLTVTGLGRPVYWGVYLTNFVFFIGISHAGTLISAILRVTQAEWRRSITRIAEAITVFALVLGVSQVLIDMGRPDRLLNPLLYGRFQSPLLWDFASISVYLLSSLTYLYLPLIPDLARMRDRMTDAPTWRQTLYRLMALGWRGNEKQVRRLEKAIGVMAILIIPIAVSVHTVVSWVFGMTLQPMWHSTILGPYFVVGAIFSGIAMLFIFMTLVRQAWHLEEYITEKQYNYLGILLLVMSAFWFYFTLAEYLTTFYGGLSEEAPVVNAKLFGEYAFVFWAMVVLNFVVPFAILLWRRGRGPTGTFVASVAIATGMWLERFTIVAPTLTKPGLMEWAVYQPTWVEVAITSGSVALFSMLFLVFFKIFPAISAWEVEEGQEIEARNAAAFAALAAQGSTGASLEGAS